MNTVLQSDADIALQTTASNLTPTPKSDSSPKIQEHPQKLFQTIKKAHPHSRKKNLFFSTTNHKEESSIAIDNEMKCISDLSNKPKHLCKFKENYLDLLINSLNTQLNNGIITLEYLNTPSHPNLSSFYDTSLLENDSNPYSIKCENKICAVVVDDPSNIFYAKFSSSFSLKPQTMWLCSKCFDAYKKGNYCYFCNVIYRDFEFNQQYYDRKKWILCEYCQKWQHMQCEEKKGHYKNIEELAMNSNFKYMCPFCRKESRQIIRSHSKSEKMIGHKTKRHCML